MNIFNSLLNMMFI